MRVTLGQLGRVVGNCDPVNGVYITCCSINNANMHRHNMDTPTRIAFGFKIFRLQSIDLVTKVYLLDFALYVSWKPGTDRQSSWVPAFYITNQVGSLREADRCVEARDDGSVELFVRYEASLSCDLDLCHFPFDKQCFQVIIRVPRLQAQGLAVPTIDERCVDAKNILEEVYQATGADGKLRLDEYAVVGLHSHVRCSGKQQQKAEVVIELDLKRNSGYWTKNVVLPVSLIVALVFDVFLMEVKDHSGRIALVLTILLTVVSYRFMINDRMPVTSYGTALDQWLVHCFLVIVAVAVESMLVLQLARHCPLNARGDAACAAAKWPLPVSTTVYAFEAQAAGTIAVAFAAATARLFSHRNRAMHLLCT